MTDDGWPNDNRTFLSELEKYAQKGWRCASCGEEYHRIPIWIDKQPYCGDCVLKIKEAEEEMKDPLPDFVLLDLDKVRKLNERLVKESKWKDEDKKEDKE